MKTIGIILAVAVLGGIIIFFLARDGSDSLPSEGNTQQEVPAPGTNGSVPEMVANGEGGDGTSEEESSEGNTPLTIVTYTDEGFSPSTATISQGEIVRFINESSRHFWPASAIHPTHSIYPQKSGSDCLGSSFDACIAVAPGGSWEFVFSETGEWKYHDHLRASKRGVVVVE